MSWEPDWVLTCVFSMQSRSRPPSHVTLLISALDTWEYHRTVWIYLSDCVSRIATSLHLWKLLKRSSQAWHRQKMMTKVSNLQKILHHDQRDFLAINYINFQLRKQYSLPRLPRHKHTRTHTTELRVARCTYYDSRMLEKSSEKTSTFFIR